MKRYFYLLTVTASLIFTAAGQLSAQEAVNGEAETINVEGDNAAQAVPAPEAAEDVNYSYGTVASISGDQLAEFEFE